MKTSDAKSSGARPLALGVAVPRIPHAGRFLTGMIALAWIVLGLFLLDRLSLLLADYWLLESLGYPEIFWTNFRTGAVLFGTGLVVGFAGVAAAGWLNPVSRGARRFALNAGAMLGLAGGYFLARHYAEFLVVRDSVSFGEADPVFGRDLGFFVFTLPAAEITIHWLLSAVGAALLFSGVYGYLAAGRGEAPATTTGAREEDAARDGGEAERSGRGPLLAVVARISTPLTLTTLVLFGLLLSAATWLKRYDVLLADNTDSGIFTGASYIDATGLLSTVNYYLVTSVVVAASAAALAYLLHLVRRRFDGEGDDRERGRRIRLAVGALALLVAFDFTFRLAVTVRDAVAVSPNEPVIQLDFIQTHLDATREAYALNGLEEVSFVPAVPGDRIPSADSLLASPALRDAPLWPGFVSRLERLLDPQHAQRILQTAGDATVYGPTLEIFRQQEKLRTYYDFLDVDTDRYRIGDERRMFVTAPRELPLIEPQPWLAWWGQRFVLFTHGWGFVAAPTGGISAEGDPAFAVRDIPARVDHPALDVENPRIYHGEGARSIAYTNVREMEEFDVPTEEGRAEYVLPDSVRAGIRLDSFAKRLVFGWRSRQFFDILFSSLIGDETRAHIYRTPLERVEKLAPFLYLDTDPFTFVHDERIAWMVNGISHTDRYPNSLLQELGDKSDERSPTPRPPVRANYARDAVKATVDAYTGQVRLYKIADEPVVNTWEAIYPTLFQSADAMPAGVREHLQYPVQLFHLQFDDVHILYHMDDPMTFFNMEDMWDDGDEVLGPVLDRGDAITFSIEPYNWMAGSGPWSPGGTRPEGAAGAGAGPATAGRFALSQLFTPEQALNLRAMPTVYQDGDEYGRIVVHTVPKGRYVMGPEQADAAIDQNPAISQQFSWWNRQGTDVIRGHTTGLLVGNELLYVEPIFLRSQQNPVTQLKRVAVVFRGQAAMAPTLEEALRTAVRRAEQTSPPAETRATQE